MWAAGVAGGAALIAWWRVVGRGFLWLAAGTAALLGAAAWLAGGGPSAAAATGALLGAALLASRSPAATAVAFGVATLGFLIAAASAGGWPAALTGAVALGGVTDEMLLGHWYLVDPRLPRRPLRRLAAAALVGVAGDVLYLGSRGAFSWTDTATTVGWAYVALAAVSLLLVVGVLLALRERAYAGVMAATGLSYLAVLTVIGGTVAGRALIAGGFGLLAAVKIPWL